MGDTGAGWEAGHPRITVGVEWRAPLFERLFQYVPLLNAQGLCQRAGDGHREHACRRSVLGGGRPTELEGMCAHGELEKMI